MPYFNRKDKKGVKSKTLTASDKKKKEDEQKSVNNYTPCLSSFYKFANLSDMSVDNKVKEKVHQDIKSSISRVFKELNDTGQTSPADIQFDANQLFYEYDSINTIACFVQTLFLSEPSKYLSPIDKGGKPSVFGIVLFAYAKGTKKSDGPVAIFKVAQRVSDEHLTTHEAFIGIELNVFRKVIPNFSYIYGHFTCEKPVGTKAVKLHCDGKNKKYNFVAYEPVFPSITMSDLCKTCTFDDFLDKFVQVILALDLAYIKKSYTHYDLHTENVLIRYIDRYKKFYIKYGTSKYVLTNGVATVIDYGLSYIEKDGKKYGIPGREVYSIFPNKPFPLYDAWKLFYWSLEDLKRNKSTFNQALEMLPFFTTDTWPNIARPEDLPYNKMTASYTHKDLINYIKKKYPYMIEAIPKRGVKVLNE